eukprot:COSAG02_NODE_28453_length_589_cov_1.022449_1_plen_38_part_01
MVLNTASGKLPTTKNASQREGNFFKQKTAYEMESRDWS